MNMDDMKYEEIDLTGEKSVADKWILTRLNETIESVTRNMDKYEFGEAGRSLYNFIWDDFVIGILKWRNFHYTVKMKQQENNSFYFSLRIRSNNASITPIHAIRNRENLATFTA